MPITKGHTMANDTISPETQHKMAMLERQHELNEKRELLAEQLSSFVNGAGDQEMAELACDMSNDHRSLVQKKMGLFLKFCKVLSEQEKDGRYDARNEYSVKLASQIMKLTDGFTYTPFI